MLRFRRILIVSVFEIKDDAYFVNFVIQHGGNKVASTCFRDIDSITFNFGTEVFEVE